MYEKACCALKSNDEFTQSFNKKNPKSGTQLPEYECKLIIYMELDNQLHDPICLVMRQPVLNLLLHINRDFPRLLHFYLINSILILRLHRNKELGNLADDLGFSHVEYDIAFF